MALQKTFFDLILPMILGLSIGNYQIIRERITSLYVPIFEIRIQLLGIQNSDTFIKTWFCENLCDRLVIRWIYLMLGVTQTSFEFELIRESIWEGFILFWYFGNCSDKLWNFGRRLKGLYILLRFLRCFGIDIFLNFASWDNTHSHSREILINYY